MPRLPRGSGAALALVAVLHLVNGASVVVQALEPTFVGLAVLNWGTWLAGIVGVLLLGDLIPRGRAGLRIAGPALLVTLAATMALVWTPEGGWHRDLAEPLMAGGLFVAGVVSPVAYQVARDADRWPVLVSGASALVLAGVLGPAVWAELASEWAAGSAQASYTELANRLAPAWAVALGGLAEIGLGVGLAGSTQVDARLPDRASSERFAVASWWLAGVGLLVVSWAIGGGLLGLDVWWIPLVLLAGPPLVEFQARPRRAAIVAGLLVVGVLPVLECSGELWTDADGSRPAMATIMLLELAMRGPWWSQGGAFERLTLDCPASLDVLAGSMALLLVLLALWRPAAREVPVEDRWLPFETFDD